jgi:glycosyltransferase involved in cell wall biosynthesis
VVDSQATKQDLIDFYGADPARLSVVYLGRDENLQPVEAPEVIAQTKARYHIEGDYLLYLGTLQPRKNLVRLIEAFQLALAFLPQPGPKLVIAGPPGWLYEAIVERVRQLGLTGQVIFPGYVAPEDKAALLSGALVYLLPSLYEGFGLPVLEAMACGTPVLTSNCSSLPEVAGQAARLVNPHRIDDIAAGLVELITNADLRRRLVEQGYRQIQQFSWQNAARQVVEILEQSAYPSSHPTN